MRPGELNVSVSQHDGGRPVIVAAGEIDLDTSAQLASVLRDTVNAGTSRLILDLTQVSFCDSTGLSALVNAHESVRESPGGAVVLVGVQPAVHKVLGITGIAQLFEYYETAEVAVHEDSGQELT